MAITLWRRPRGFLNQSSVVAIGNFDGMHLGHQYILSILKQKTQHTDKLAVLLTFAPYPQLFFNSVHSFAVLTSLREKCAFLEKEKIDLLYALPFNATIAHYLPQQFVEEILLKQLHATDIIIGEDFRFGYQRRGDIRFLSSYDLFTTTVIAPVKFEEQRISSTWVRECLQQGELKKAEALLGRPYSLTGRVVKGNQLGRQLGFPTANIALYNRKTPLNGVFMISVKGILPKAVCGVANIGTRPTVDGTKAFLEAYLLDFDQDIYGKYLEITFLEKLRDEKRFASLDALKAQIQKDVMMAREYFNACY